jgi:two-component system phosphate regulon sensor histidine kinase PhoR
VDFINTIVEKLLETATLDSDSLSLNKEEINLVDFINTIVEKQEFTLNNKTISFKHTHDIISTQVDLFHFENAINNIIDNAIKYGGNSILVEVNKNNEGIVIKISDNGNSLTKVNKHKIFEKFYRVPKGNTHDVKGFGIGLYYTKKIVEKHHGTIQLELKNNLATFKITLPNG